MHTSLGTPHAKNLGMKTTLSFALIALALAFPLVLIADVLGLQLPASINATNAVILYVGLGLGLIIANDYREKPLAMRKSRRSDSLPLRRLAPLHG